VEHSRGIKRPKLRSRLDVLLLQSTYNVLQTGKIELDREKYLTQSRRVINT
jgi:hypothetical protein